MTAIKADWRDVSATGGAPVLGDSEFGAADFNAHAAQINTNTDDIAAQAAEIAAAYVKPGGGIPSTDLTTAVQNLLTAASTAYQKPGGGIPSADLASAVQALLTAASTAVQPAAMASAIATAVTGVLKDKGVTDCSTNPNYPAAVKGDAYVVTVAGKIGGAAGVVVGVGDVYFATSDNAGGTQASVGASWDVLPHTLVGALMAGNNLSDVASPATARTNLGLGNVDDVSESTILSAAASAAASSSKSADTITDGIINKVLTAADKTRLANTSGTNTGDQTSVSGNAGTATKLATPRNINSVPFDGSTDVTVADATKADLVTVKSGQPWWDSAFTAPIADDTPTVTVATSSAIGGGTTIAPTADMADAHFRYDGCVSVSTPGAGLVAPDQPSVAGATYVLVPEFVTSQGCDKVDVIVKTNSAGTALGLRLTINGKWLTLPLSWSVTTANTTYYLQLVFPTAKSRSIRVETVNVGTFGGVVVPSGETVTRPARDIQKRMVILGDSYVAGANKNTTTDPTTNGCSQFETFPNYLAKLLGCDSVINLGIGGTGWVAVGSYAAFGARVADLIAASPHIVVAAGSRNDNSATGAQVYAAAVSALSQFADVPIIEVCGIEDAGSGSGTAAATLNEAVKQAARTVGRRFNDMINVIGSSDKNTADNVHPSVIGAQKLAKAFYASVDRAYIDGIVAAAVGGRSSTDLTLAASPSSAAHVGATVTLTATQSVQRAGSVAFYANNVLLGTSAVSAGVATYATSALAVATYAFTARFIPSNPLQVKPATANAISGYVVDANLGFVDHFTTTGALTATENGKTYTVGGGTGSAAAGSGVATITVSAGTVYVTADAGDPNGTFSVKLGGTSLTSVVIPLRYVNGTNTLRLRIVSSQIELGQVVAGSSTVVATGSTGVWAAADVISVIFANDTITVQKNGTNVTGLVGITCSTFDTATKFGIGANGAGPTFDDLTFVAA